MREYMITLLVCSITMSVVALVYMAITPLLAKRYSVSGRYYAWLVIILGFLVPFRPQWDNPLFQVSISEEIAGAVMASGEGMALVEAKNEERAVPAGANEESAVSAGVNEEGAAPAGADEERAAPAGAKGEEGPEVMGEITPSLKSGWAWWQIIAAVWWAGMGVRIGYQAIRHYRFLKMARRWREPLQDQWEGLMLRDLQAEMGMTRKIGLERCAMIGTPMLTGFVRSRILLPAKEFAPADFRFILQHELVHYRRKDLYYKGLVVLVTCIHWFNPVIYLAAKAIGVNCESSCDRAVVGSRDLKTRRHYSEVILNVVRDQAKWKTALSTNFYGGKNSMRNRIGVIMDSGKKKTGTIILGIVLAATLGTGCAFATNGPAQVQAQTGINWPFPWLEAQNHNADMVRQFAEYEQYGLAYDPDSERLYFNGELVRYFEDLVSDSTYKRWPAQDGTVDVCGVRNAAGELTGVAASSQQVFDQRTPSLADEIPVFSITNSITESITISPTASGPYYTAEMEQDKKELLAQEYAIYQPFGLTYHKDSDSLTYNGETVGYFEDENLHRYFGSKNSREEQGAIIYAVRNFFGKLTGLEVRDPAAE